MFSISNECFEQPDNAQLWILDRKGELMYQTGEMYDPWDGRNQQGNRLPDGVYYYILRFTLNGETQQPIKGYVMLLSQGR
ncbi:MAG: hypothetical protein HC892_16325 [Saprospiraceae bacterium]|nr:hypothetical protein [Saprospiraceae bacterium]